MYFPGSPGAPTHNISVRPQCGNSLTARYHHDSDGTVAECAMEVITSAVCGNKCMLTRAQQIGRETEKILWIGS